MTKEELEGRWKAQCPKGKDPDTWVKECYEARLKYQTDLFFLCNELGYKKLTEEAHRPICDFFVKKDPVQYNSFEDFANAYVGIKDRLLLVPRGGFKSSIDICDCVQWIVCFPEITILILTGVYDLACDFVKELRLHFTLKQDGEQWIPKNKFQFLFWDHCVEPGGKATEFTTPAREERVSQLNVKSDKEPSVMAASIEQNLSGWHFCIMKLDDVVTNENSLTPGRIAGINKQVNVNRAMLHPYGYYDKIGTWYDEGDTYGKDLKHLERLAKEGESPTMLVYLYGALWLTDKAKKEGKALEPYVKREDVVLWCPEILTFEFLIKEWKRDPEGFPIKYLNDPRMVHQVKFPRELLLARTVPATMLPPTGIIVATIDTAYSVKSWADYTVIITAMIFGGRFYIIDMSRGRYNEYDLPAVIAQTGFKWKPKRIAIEDSVGVRWIGREIRREMDKLNISIPVEYISLGLGSKTKAKEIKAKPVVRLLGDERMFFVNSCSGLEEIYTELEKFGQADTHDDIVSALSLLVEVFGPYAEVGAKTNITADSISTKQDKARHDLIYGLGRFSRYNASTAMDDNPVTAYQLENKTTETFTDHDPLAEAGLLE